MIVSKIRHGVFYLRAERESCVRISPGLRRRTLLILDAVARALEARGHSVTFESASGAQKWGPYRIHAKVNGESISIHFFEPLLRSDAVLTPEQRAQEKKHGWFIGRKHVFTPSGKLTIRAEGDWVKEKWSDGSPHTVEQKLGAVVLGIEQIAVRVQENAAESARQEQRRRDEERRSKLVTAQANYQRALVLDLESMATRWQRSRTIKAFLDDVEVRVSAELRSASFEAWLGWAKAQVSSLDPMTDAGRMPKVLDLDFLAMPDEELNRWLRWAPP